MGDGLQAHGSNTNHAVTGTMHSRMFDAALQDALNNISDFGFTPTAPGEPYTVRVEFVATVSVSNPGRVDGYKVTLTQVTDGT